MQKKHLRHFFLDLDPSIHETHLRHFFLDLDPSIYVVTLYERVGGGDLLQRIEWFRSLRSLNHNKGSSIDP